MESYHLQVYNLQDLMEDMYIQDWIILYDNLLKFWNADYEI
jgi:hypothetical protein